MLRPFFAAVLLSVTGLICAPVLAADAPDLSTPKKAAIAFAKAIESGDLPAAKATSIGTESDYKLIQNISDFFTSAKQLREAAVAKFGDQGKQISEEDMTNFSKQLESGNEKIEGDVATVGKADEKDPMKLKKGDAGWKVDLSAMPDKEQMAKAMPKMQKVMTQAAADIKEGKYKTVDDAKQAIGQQIFAVMAEQLNGQPGAAPQPPADAASKQANDPSKQGTVISPPAPDQK